MKALGHSTRKHDQLRTVLQQFLHVGDLNTRPVSSSCLAPIPFAGTAGEKLCVLVRLGFALNLEPAPRNMLDPRRSITALHHKRFRYWKCVRASPVEKANCTSEASRESRGNTERKAAGSLDFAR